MSTLKKPLEFAKFVVEVDIATVKNESMSSVEDRVSLMRYYYYNM